MLCSRPANHRRPERLKERAPLVRTLSL